MVEKWKTTGKLCDITETLAGPVSSSAGLESFRNPPSDVWDPLRNVFYS